MLEAISSTQLAMKMDQLKLQSTNQNIANMNTVGFKKQFADHLRFESQMQETLNNTAEQLQIAQLNVQGSFAQTDKSTDLALSGPGYFQVQGEHGIYYTRRGDFQINNQGELATETGEIVLGNGGAIKINDAHFTINTAGALCIDHQQVNQLQILQLDTTQLKYMGQGLYQTTETPMPSEATTQVLQGFLEHSNVKSMDEMMDLIQTSRHFEANQTVMRTANNLLATAISQLGESNV